jgi:hypothetical protein
VTFVASLLTPKNAAYLLLYVSRNITNTAPHSDVVHGNRRDVYALFESATGVCCAKYLCDAPYLIQATNHAFSPNGALFRQTQTSEYKKSKALAKT